MENAKHNPNPLNPKDSNDKRKGKPIDARDTKISNNYQQGDRAKFLNRVKASAVLESNKDSAIQAFASQVAAIEKRLSQISKKTSIIHSDDLLTRLRKVE